MKKLIRYCRWQARSFCYAGNGLKRMLADPKAPLHGTATASVLLAGYYFQITASEWCWVLLAITLVWMAETFNSAIETLTDLVHPAPHPLAGRAKDLSAAAVLIAAFFAFFIGIAVFYPYVVARY